MGRLTVNQQVGGVHPGDRFGKDHLDLGQGADGSRGGGGQGFDLGGDRVRQRVAPLGGIGQVVKGVAFQVDDGVVNIPGDQNRPDGGLGESECIGVAGAGQCPTAVGDRLLGSADGGGGDAGQDLAGRTATG